MTPAFERTEYETIAPGGAHWWIWSLDDASPVASDVLERLRAHSREVVGLEEPKLYSVKDHEGGHIVVFDDGGREDVAVGYAVPPITSQRAVRWFYVPM